MTERPEIERPVERRRQYGMLNKPRSYTLGALIPVVIIAIATNVGAWFRLDAIADQRAADLVALEAQRAEDLARDAELETYRDCVDLALIETKLREVFVLVSEKFPDAVALTELSATIDERFPAMVEDCPIPPDDD